MLTIVLALGACNPFGVDDGRMCTAEFAMVTFRVVDTSGTPEDGFVVTVTNLRTHEVYDVTQPSYEVGLYVALDDSFLGRIRSKGDQIRVHGAKDGREFDAQFTIAAGECHVEKLFGPDTVGATGP